jgi:hypothetical protein
MGVYFKTIEIEALLADGGRMDNIWKDHDELLIWSRTLFVLFFLVSLN